MSRRVLMIAYHYPPVGVSSGVQRTLAFSRYLLDLGWQPIVLTISPCAYERTDEGQLQDIPEGVAVIRAFGRDVARHFALAGHYFDWMALPDRWNSWWLGAVLAGSRLIKEYKPDVIWSTYPIATAHCIASTLSGQSGVPWVADFRDSMVDDSYPAAGLRRSVFKRIESRTLRQASSAVFTTAGTLAMYRDRYPGIEAGKFRVIENGYDEPAFASVMSSVADSKGKRSGPTLLVHSGLLYSSERDPSCFFRAISILLANKLISADTLRIVLRASGEEAQHQATIDELGIQEIVKLEPPISYRDALLEMLNADGLLLFQAENCDHQIPAKLYEYIRARKPIFAMLGLQGETANLLRASGDFTVVSLASVDQIVTGLSEFLASIDAGLLPIASDKVVKSHSRQARTRELVDVFESVLVE